MAEVNSMSERLVHVFHRRNGISYGRTNDQSRMSGKLDIVR